MSLEITAWLEVPNTARSNNVHGFSVFPDIPPGVQLYIHLTFYSSQHNGS